MSQANAHAVPMTLYESPCGGHCACGGVRYRCGGTLKQPSGLHTEASLWTEQAADYHPVDPDVVAYAREQDAGP